MKHINQFQSWLINEDAGAAGSSGTSGTAGNSAPYPSLENYLSNYPVITACLQKPGSQSTHILNGTYYDLGFGRNVQVKLIGVNSGTISGPFTSEGPDSIADHYYKALAQLVEYLKKNPGIVISTTEFPLPPGVTVTGVKSNLTKSN